jgi:hypothetical protein
MTKLLISCLMLASGCDYIYPLFETAEKVLTDEAIKVEVYKDSIPKGDQLEADIKIVPIEQPLPPPEVVHPIAD